MKTAHLIATLCLAGVLAACSNYSAVQKSTDPYFKYEAAKEFYVRGHYSRAADLLNQVLPALRGTEVGEEALFMHGLATLHARDYEAAATILKKYIDDFPRGRYNEQAYYNCAMAYYKNVPEVKLDQTSTYDAIRTFSAFLENYPRSPLANDAREKMFELQDQLIEKEWLSAKLYYDLGSYFLNCSSGGSNYQACITTAENALRDYPYMKRREDFLFLILQAKFDLADQSVLSRREERLADAIEEYKNFIDEFPTSSRRQLADQLYNKHTRHVQISTDSDN